MGLLGSLNHPIPASAVSAIRYCLSSCASSRKPALTALSHSDIPNPLLHSLLSAGSDPARPSRSATSGDPALTTLALYMGGPALLAGAPWPQLL